MKKIVTRIILVIGILFMLIKIYHFVVMNKVYNAVESFKSERNNYYSVVTTSPNGDITLVEIFRKENIVKYKIHKDDIFTYYKWKDFNDNLEYSIDVSNKTFKEEELLFEEEIFATLPNLIVSTYRNNKLNISQFLKIKYIIPIKYNNQKCYKIKNSTQTLIVDRSTYLPVYYAKKQINSSKGSEDLIENTYEFKVGEVKDEDILLPNLTGYTNISEKQ